MEATTISASDRRTAAEESWSCRDGGVCATQRSPSGTCDPTFVRGEDVPLLANELARSGRSVLAFTGEDLLEEWLAGGRTLDARITRRSIAWNDPSARYGKPALCLIGPRGVPLPERGRPARRALC